MSKQTIDSKTLYPMLESARFYLDAAKSDVVIESKTLLQHHATMALGILAAVEYNFDLTPAQQAATSEFSRQTIDLLNTHVPGWDQPQ